MPMALPNDIRAKIIKHKQNGEKGIRYSEVFSDK